MSDPNRHLNNTDQRRLTALTYQFECDLAFFVLHDIDESTWAAETDRNRERLGHSFFLAAEQTFAELRVSQPLLTSLLRPNKQVFRVALLDSITRKQRDNDHADALRWQAARYIEKAGAGGDPQKLADALRQITGAREVAVRMDSRNPAGRLMLGKVAVSK